MGIRNGILLTAGLALGCASSGQNLETRVADVRGPEISTDIDPQYPGHTCVDLKNVETFLGVDKNDGVLDTDYPVDFEVKCIEGRLRRFSIKDEETGKAIHTENYDPEGKAHGLSGSYDKDGNPLWEKKHEHGTLLSERAWHEKEVPLSTDKAKLASEKKYDAQTGIIELERVLNESGVEVLLRQFHENGVERLEITRYGNGKKSTEDRFDADHKAHGTSFVWTRSEKKLYSYNHRHGMQVGTQTEWFKDTTTKSSQDLYNENGGLEYRKSWHPSGTLKEDKSYDHDVPVGTHWDYFSGGKKTPQHKNSFDLQGNQHGDETIWNKGNEVIYNVFRHHGKKMGYEVSIEDDTTTKTHYVNGVKHGLFEVLDADGLLIDSGEFVNGVLR